MKGLLIASTTIFGLVLAATAPNPAYAQASTKDVVRSDNNSIVQTKTGACVRTRWQDSTDACAPPAPPPPPPVVVQMPPPVVVQAPPPRTVIREEERTVYFEFNRDQLTPEAKQRLDALAMALRGAKDIQRAEIVGFADPMGSTKYNQALSERRAYAVESYLNAQGYLNTSRAQVRAVGEDQASADCAKKMKRNRRIECLATDRKVEVQIVYATLVR